MALWLSQKESISRIQCQAGLPAPIIYKETHFRKSKLTLIAMRSPYTPPSPLNVIQFLWIRVSAYMASATLNKVLQDNTPISHPILSFMSLRLHEAECLPPADCNDWRRQHKAMGAVSLSSPSTLEFSRSIKEAKNLTQSVFNQT